MFLLDTMRIRNHFFKLYNLKIEDIYKFRLLVLYHNISHFKTPQYLEFFWPNTSQENIHYAMRNPRLQLPVHFHEFIKTTCRYLLPTLLNNLNAESKILKHNWKYRNLNLVGIEKNYEELFPWEIFIFLPCSWLLYMWFNLIQSNLLLFMNVTYS